MSLFPAHPDELGEEFEEIDGVLNQPSKTTWRHAQ